MDLTDYLGLAAEEKHNGLNAIKAKKFDDAWRHFHQQKSYYTKHANRCGFSARDALCLIATVDKNLADVLRHDGKHKQALLHISYAYATSRHRMTSTLEKSLTAYFNRCKLSTDFGEFKQHLETLPDLVDFFQLKSLVDDLR